MNQLRAARGLTAFSNEADAARYYVQNFVGAPQYGAERSNADFDLRHAAVLNFIYELPFGPGHAFASSAHGVTRWLIGGWQTNGILRFQTGTAFSLLAGVDVNGNGVVNDRAALLSGSLSKLFNPNFRQNGDRRYLINNQGAVLGISPTPEFIGSMTARNVLYSPGVVNVDFAVFKNNRLREGIILQFRAESFNLFNHTNFGAPVTNIASSQFGFVSSTQAPGRQVQLGLKLVF